MFYNACICAHPILARWVLMMDVTKGLKRRKFYLFREIATLSQKNWRKQIQNTTDPMLLLGGILHSMLLVIQY